MRTKLWQKHDAEISNCNRQSYNIGNKNDLNAGLDFLWIGFETECVQLFLLKVSTLKIRTFRGLIWKDAVGSTRCLRTRVLQQNGVRMTKIF